MQTLTEEQIVTLYQVKQREDFPTAKKIVACVYAVIFLAAGFAAYVFFMWVLVKLFKI